MSLPQDCTPDYSGPHVFVSLSYVVRKTKAPLISRLAIKVMHRVVIKSKSKHGVEADHLTQFPLRIVAVAFDERVRLTSGKKGAEPSSARKGTDDRKSSTHMDVPPLIFIYLFQRRPLIWKRSWRWQEQSTIRLRHRFLPSYEPFWS
jgi:hypothetical protein